MKRDIHLYISNQEVYFGEEPEILFTYQQTDLKNPTVVKNSYTKTIEIDGIKDNNRVFNQIYHLERSQSGQIYNPSMRAPFVLMDGNEILESGYAKLDNVIRNGYGVRYQITLYGGLGDVFYRLTYREDGNKMTMADLDYFKDDGDIADIDFNITKDIVNDAWNALYSLGEEGETDLGIYNIVNFAPAYNGKPDTIDGDKVLISTRNTSSIDMRYLVTYGEDSGDINEINGFPRGTAKNADPYSGTISGITDGNYRVYNGYALAELGDTLTEWEAKDLRSYLQRPVIRVKKMIEAIANPSNNGGFEFDLDPNFFNADNPYYNDAWITLPLLTEINLSDTNTTHKSSNLPVVMEERIDDLHYVLASRFQYGVQLPSETVYSFSSAQVDFSLGVQCNTEAPILYLTTGWYKKTQKGWFSSEVSEGSEKSSIFVQVIGYDKAGNIAAASPVHNFTNKVGGGRYEGQYSTFMSKTYKTPLSKDYGEVVHFGCFYESDGNEYIWKDDATGNNTFRLTLNGEFESVKVYVDVFRSTGNYIFASDFVNGMTYDEYGYTPRYDVLVDPLGAAEYRESSTMRSGMHITKERLLGGLDGTPCDFLLSYCKLFNLYFEKDRYSNTLHIRTRGNWYDGKTVDIDDKIGRGDDMKISPITFDAKWYDLNYPEGDVPELMQKYKDDYSLVYGRKRINTGYNFDNSSTDLLEGNVFSNGISVLEQSKYFRFLRSNASETYGLPTFLLGGDIDYKLFALGGEGDVDINLYKPTEFQIDDYSSVGNYYDCFDKLQFHSADGKSVDGSGVLCFFNGHRSATSHRQAGGTYSPAIIQYGLSDDLPEMQMLNDNYCWLYTNDEYAPLDPDNAGDKISIKLTYIPQFSRYRTNRTGSGEEDYTNETIVSAWDFGMPRELYIPAVTISDNADIYSKYWINYVRDLYDIDTRVVEAYTVLDGQITVDALRHFYYFDNSLWVINKITDYNAVSYDKTKVEFIKVNDPNAYSDHYVPPVIPHSAVLTLSQYEVTGATTITATVTADSDTTWHLESAHQWLRPSISVGADFTGNKTFTVYVGSSQLTNYESMPISIRTEEGVVSEAVIKYVGSGSAIRLVVLQPTDGNVPASGGTGAVGVACEGEWMVEGNDYVTFNFAGESLKSNPIYGEGQSVLIVNFDSNEGNERYATIRGKSGSNVHTVYIGQEGIYSNITITAGETNFTNSGGTSTITVDCDGEWTISNSASWVHIQQSQGSGDDVFNFTVDAYTGNTTRTATIAGLSGSFSSTITIVQNPYLYINLNSPSLDIIGGGETITGTISSNANWEIEIIYE